LANQDSLKSSLIFHDYVVNHVNFEKNKNFENQSIDIKFDIKRNVVYEDDMAYVTVNTLIFENAVENNYPFTLDISVEGKFEVNSADEKQKEELTTKNTVAILFPYIRALVSNYTANANVPPLILPPINVLKILD